MYQAHFGLNKLPFGLTPDTRFFYELPTHKEALNVLLVALQNGEGFIKITGDVGTGKTMLCRKLLNDLPPPFQTAYIPNPHLSPAGLRMAIADELGITYFKSTAPNQLLRQINDFLIAAALAGTRLVLIIDEAQAMPLETLEALRLLTNLETEQQKLLQIVLFGQPELDTLLGQKSIRQLRQRITFSYALKPLNTADVALYLQHRLQVAGNSQPMLFSKTAITALHFFSHGIPRLINILAHKALLSAYGKGLGQARLKQIYAAAVDTEVTQTALLPVCHKIYILGLLIALSAYFGLALASML